MYNEEYVDIRNCYDLQQKIVDYNDKYKNGFIYLYDNNKILIDSINELTISKSPCIKITDDFIWHDKVDFFDKIVSVENFSYVLPEIGDYLIINQKNKKYVGMVDKKYYNIYSKVNQQYYYPMDGDLLIATLV